MDIEKQINDFCKDFNPEQKKLFFESFPAKPEVLEDMLADAKEHPALFEKIRLIMRDFRNNKENPEFWNLMEKYGAKEVIYPVFKSNLIKLRNIFLEKEQNLI